MYSDERMVLIQCLLIGTVQNECYVLIQCPFYEFT